MSTQMTLDSVHGIDVFRPSAAAGVAAPAPRVLEPADWVKDVKPSTISEMLKVMARPNLISFALGLPAPELFPVEEFTASAARVLAGDRGALQYRPPSARLKKQVVELMAQRGVRCTEEQVFLTTAAQQGLALLARLFLNHGAQVITEQLIYTGFQQVIEPFQPRILAVPTDFDTGIDVDAVERLLEGGARPGFIYVISDGHNPVGVSVSPEKRARLVQLARRFGVPIVEDDAYGLLNFGQAVPPMRAMDDEWVFYVGSLSKVMAPGFRIGWIVAPERFVPVLGCAKDASDIDTSTFTQALVSEYIESGHFSGHLPRVRDAYRERRDVMLAALARHFPTGARWTVPTNGALIWLDLPRHVDTGKLLKVAVETEGVAFVPGNAFACDGSRAGSNGMRLNFSHPSPKDIEEGIGRLARAVRSTFG
ncbi:MAG TPA: PLP-dependent aminotransferase family protein [Longimicrobiaceae bacterium]|jgi:2-aminoadipate transaminase|nr:PLP-dependent aminotransferase family protein [Longimicrobiaceae bacterium]